MKKIIIFTGDPNSVNSEIIFKCWRKISNSLKKKIYFISNFQLLKKQFRKLNYSSKMVKVNDIEEYPNVDKMKIYDVNFEFRNPFKIERKKTSIFIKRSLNIAHNFGMKKNVIGIINCAIDKKLLNNKGYGVTEFLASKCKVKKDTEVMLIKSKKLSVSPITTHLNLNNVSKKISKQIIIKKINTIHNWFKKIYKRKPKIAVLGLNPHNSEFTKTSEERRIILPVILKLKKRGINLKGPFAADTIFINDYKNFDVVVGMYHDQVLAPFKTIFKFDAINITLGLKYLRASPDHGTAVSLIGKNKANPESLIQCVKFFNNFS